MLNVGKDAANESPATMAIKLRDPGLEKNFTRRTLPESY
jgi:hypothetical protein